MNPLYAHPHLLAFLQDIKQHPDDDTPRLILADWLEDHDDAARAEFMRVQCRLPSAAKATIGADERGALLLREEQLLARHGGTWLGPFWNWRPTEYDWRRGLLSVRLVRPLEDLDEFADVLPWIDTLHAEMHGWRMAQQVAELLNRGAFNHFQLTLRRVFSESQLLDCFGKIKESPCLQTLCLCYVRPSGRQRSGEGIRKSGLYPSRHFLSRLVSDLPLGRNLTQLGIGPRMTAEDKTWIRSLGLKPVDPQIRM